MMKVTKMQEVFGLLLRQCFLYCSPQIFFFKIITNKTLELNLETSTALSQLEE